MRMSRAVYGAEEGVAVPQSWPKELAVPCCFYLYNNQRIKTGFSLYLDLLYSAAADKGNSLRSGFDGSACVAHQSLLRLVAVPYLTLQIGCGQVPMVRPDREAIIRIGARRG